MKHISSIRSIYFKRFVLAALLGVVSISAWADSGNTYGQLTAKTDSNSDSNGAGKIYISTTALLQGSYSGMIDTSKINKKEFNWMRSFDE